MRTHALALAVVLLAACGGSTDPGDDPDAATNPPDADPTTLVTDPLHDLPTGVDQWTALCARGYGDLISQKICAGNAPPVLTSLADLRALLGLVIDPNPTGSQPNVRFTFLGHSTALPQRHVSALNPRLFVFTIPNTDGSANNKYQVLAFARGEAFVELVANDPTAGTLRFFLLRFHPQCESTAAGCNYADLYTPTLETGWTGWSIYDDEDLKNTTVDCRQCHQVNGPGTNKILRMQEITHPWLHWFYEEIPENEAMIDDVYLAARPGGEVYGGVPSPLVHPSRPFALEHLVENNGFTTQPNAFDSTAIRAEMVGGSSPTWNAIYANAVAGNAIPVPYYGVPQTDPTKIAAAVQAYKDVANGTLPRDQMPDLADVFLDSAEPLMSHRPATGLDGNGILRHMCQHCHNSKLDQTISRSGFNVETLAALPPSEKQEAIRRLQLDPADIHHMPPTRFATLSQAEIDLAITALSQ